MRPLNYLLMWQPLCHCETVEVGVQTRPSFAMGSRGKLAQNLDATSPFGPFVILIITITFFFFLIRKNLV